MNNVFLPPGTLSLPYGITFHWFLRPKPFSLSFPSYCISSPSANHTAQSPPQLVPSLAKQLFLAQYTATASWIYLPAATLAFIQPAILFKKNMLDHVTRLQNLIVASLKIKLKLLTVACKTLQDLALVGLLTLYPVIIPSLIFT